MDINERLTWDEYFMKMVYLVASKSKDPRTRIGSVLVKDKNIISTGYNGICRGVLDPSDDNSTRELYCKMFNEFKFPENLYQRQEKPFKYSWYEHGERNSIYAAARNGVSTLGSTLYSQGVPCCDCGRACIQAGIKEIVVHGKWPRNGLNIEYKDSWSESIEISIQMFKEAGIGVLLLDKELGLEGYLDGNVIKV